MMNTPNPRLDRGEYLASLRESDESIEDLLSGGVDIDDLLEAGLIDDRDSELFSEPESHPNWGVPSIESNEPDPIAPF
jgi:hypothetical protein